MKIKVKKTSKGNAKKALKKVVGTLGNVSILVGVPKDAAAYPDGTETAIVAAVHEFGAPSKNIPERSYLRSTLTDNQAKYIQMAQKGIKRVVNGKMSLKNLAGLIGLEAENDVKDKIVDLQTPALKQATIDKKGSDNPLVDTGHLVQSIRHEVREDV